MPSCIFLLALAAVDTPSISANNEIRKDEFTWMLPLPTWVRVISVVLFVVSFVVGMVVVSWYEAVEVGNDALLATIVAIIVKGESVSIVSAAITGAFEGGAFIVVIAYEMVKRGFDRGRAQAYAEANRKNAEYYKRMKEAHERGEVFDEPPPKFGNEDDEQEQD